MMKAKFFVTEKVNKIPSFHYNFGPHLSKVLNMNICILNGPNLNLVGTREPSIYGEESLDIYLVKLTEKYKEHSFQLFQSNVEGELINELQRVANWADAIIINAGAYTHTSIAIADAIKAIGIKRCVEVHISNVFARESYRRESKIAEVCSGAISGFGIKVYELAIMSLLI